MQSAKLARLSGFTVAAILAIAVPCRAQFLAPMLLQALQDLKRDLPRYNANIRMSEAAVNAIIDEMDGVAAPDPNARTAAERVRDLKKGIQSELAEAKKNLLALNVANQQLTVALDRYTKNQSPENLKNAQGIVNQINGYRDKLNGNLDNAKNMIRQIASIRSQEDDKEWNKKDGKYKDERKAIDTLWNWLQGRPTVPAVVGMKADEACALVSGIDLVPQMVSVAETPPPGREHTIKQQEPAGETVVQKGDTVRLDVYGQVVPNVVGMSLPGAVEAVGKAGLTVGGVVVERAYSREDSEKVSKQAPRAGAPVAADKTVKLWHYDRFGSTAPPPSFTRSEGFRPGDAKRIDPRFTVEKLYDGRKSETAAGNTSDKTAGQSANKTAVGKEAARDAAVGKMVAIYGNLPGQFPKPTRSCTIVASPDAKSAANQIARFSESFRTAEKINRAQEARPDVWRTKFHTRYTADEATSYFSNALTEDPPEKGASFLNSAVLYRGVFVISYQGFQAQYDYDLLKERDAAIANARKLIDERFPGGVPAGGPAMPAD